LVRLVVGIVVAVIAVAIILRLLSANPHNMIVSDIHDAGAWLVGPFKNVFSVKDAKLGIVLNWGLAAIVYLVVGGLISRVLAMGAARGFAGRRRRGVRPVV
jgi:hypothetical protein